MKKLNMPLSDAISYFGSKRKIAKALEIDPRSVSDWKEVIPELRAYQIVEIIKQKKNK